MYRKLIDELKEGYDVEFIFFRSTAINNKNNIFFEGNYAFRINSLFPWTNLFPISRGKRNNTIELIIRVYYCITIAL